MRQARSRDSQRSRQYKAERVLPGYGTNEFGSLEQTRKWLYNVMEQRWFRARWHLRGGIDVGAGRGGAASSWGGRITVGRQARNQVVVLHELTHEIINRDTNGGRQMAWHGPEFSYVFLFLVEKVMGPEAAAKLREAYRENKVKYRSGASALPTPRYHVTTQAEVARRRQVEAARPVTSSSRQLAAETIRRLVKQGEFGAAGTKTRTAALAVARTLEKGGS